MEYLFTEKWFSINLSCSNAKNRKVKIILHLKIVQNNDTMKLTFFTTVESNILTNKNVTQMAKRIEWTKKLQLS